MAEVEAREEVGGQRGSAALALADHWILYTFVIALAVLVWINILYYIGVRFNLPGLAAFAR